MTKRLQKISLDKRTGGDNRGFYIRTFTGKQFHWNNIEGNVYDIRDIAHALSMNCRWTGHVKEFYSVAQHCVYVSELVPHKHMLAALLHDASEAYIHDTPSPLKWHLAECGFTAFADLEKRVDKAVSGAFGVQWPRDPCIKLADLTMLATEHRDLMPEDKERGYMAEPCTWHIRPLLPKEAEQAFLTRFYKLHGREFYGYQASYLRAKADK